MKQDFTIAYDHADAARKAGLTWTCTCPACTAWRAHCDQRRKREAAARRHRDLLIGIMSHRHHYHQRTQQPGEQRRLADMQFEFEKIMVRKLKLQHLDSAAIYGFKPKTKTKPHAS